jgi:hypothetical protein
VGKQEESEDESSSGSSSYHLSDHYYCPSDDNEYSTSSDDDESSTTSSKPGLQVRAAENSSSEDDDSNESFDNSKDDDDASIQGSILDECDNNDVLIYKSDVRVLQDGRVACPIPIVQDAFDYGTVIPPPIPTSSSMIPPVSCVLAPNDQNDVNSLVAAPINKRIDPAGRVPIRIQQDSFCHVNDVINHKPILIGTAGETVNN